MPVRSAIVSQYLAAIDMLERAVVACPRALWDDRSYRNVFWHVAYHALFYTHLYLQPTEADFTPWVGHVGAYRSLRNVPEGEGYKKEDVLAYAAFCRDEVRRQVAALDPAAPSGFDWLKCDKAELQIYNIRHLQQHTGELYERLGVKEGLSLDWVSLGGA